MSKGEANVGVILGRLGLYAAVANEFWYITSDTKWSGSGRARTYLIFGFNVRDYDGELRVFTLHILLAKFTLYWVRDKLWFSRLK